MRGFTITPLFTKHFRAIVHSVFLEIRSCFSNCKRSSFSFLVLCKNWVWLVRPIYIHGTRPRHGFETRYIALMYIFPHPSFRASDCHWYFSNKKKKKKKTGTWEINPSSPIRFVIFLTVLWLDLIGRLEYLHNMHVIYCILVIATTVTFRLCKPGCISPDSYLSLEAIVTPYCLGLKASATFFKRKKWIPVLFWSLSLQYLLCNLLAALKLTR